MRSAPTVANTGIDLRAAVLDELHAAVNALGGYADPNDAEARGYGRALDDVLSLIEARGGQDPCVRRVAAVFRAVTEPSRHLEPARSAA